MYVFSWGGCIYVVGRYIVCGCQRAILRVLSQAPSTFSFEILTWSLADVVLSKQARLVSQ